MLNQQADIRNTFNCTKKVLYKQWKQHQLTRGKGIVDRKRLQHDGYDKET